MGAEACGLLSLLFHVSFYPMQTLPFTQIGYIAVIAVFIFGWFFAKRLARKEMADRAAQCTVIQGEIPERVFEPGPPLSTHPHYGSLYLVLESKKLTCLVWALIFVLFTAFCLIMKYRGGFALSSETERFIQDPFIFWCVVLGFFAAALRQLWKCSRSVLFFYDRFVLKAFLFERVYAYRDIEWTEPFDYKRKGLGRAGRVLAWALGFSNNTLVLDSDTYKDLYDKMTHWQTQLKRR